MKKKWETPASFSYITVIQTRKWIAEVLSTVMFVCERVFKEFSNDPMFNYRLIKGENCLIKC